MPYGEFLDLLACLSIYNGAKPKNADTADDEEMIPDIP